MNIDEWNANPIRSTNPIRIYNVTVQEQDGESILRGLIETNSLLDLKTDDYQREVGTPRQLAEMVKQGAKRLPDVELGTRGHDVVFQESLAFLFDPTFIIDGLQRISAALLAMKQGHRPVIGAVIHLDSTRTSENKRFHILNAKRRAVGADVIIHNMRDSNQAVALLWTLSQSEAFALQNRICWRRGLKASELIRARTLLKVVALLHSHGNGQPSGNYIQIANWIEEKVYNEIGEGAMRHNTMAFFELIDNCWGIRTIRDAKKASVVKAGFLSVLARVLSGYKEFWSNNMLDVPKNLARKIAKLPVLDPYVAHLCGASGLALSELHDMLVRLIKSGKRTRHLTPFWPVAPYEVDTPIQASIQVSSVHKVDEGYQVDGENERYHDDGDRDGDGDGDGGDDDRFGYHTTQPSQNQGG